MQMTLDNNENINAKPFLNGLVEKDNFWRV